MSPAVATMQSDAVTGSGAVPLTAEKMKHGSPSLLQFSFSF
jgi:hypothetical protein